MNVLKEVRETVKLLFVFILFAIMSVLTSCDSPINVDDIGVGSETVVIQLARTDMTYYHVTVMDGDEEWAVYDVFEDSLCFDKKTQETYVVRDDTVPILVPNRDSLLLYANFLGSQVPNYIKVVQDSCYTLRVN